MRKTLSIITIFTIITLLSSCKNASLKSNNTKTGTESSSVSEVTIPFNYNSDFDELATKLINSDSIEGIKINTPYKSIISKYGEPTNKSSEIVINNSSITKQTWYYDNDNLEFDMVKSRGEYVVNAIRVYGKSDAATERDIKLGSNVNDVIKAYGEEINPDLSENSIIVAGEKNKGMIFILKDDKVVSIFFGLVL